MSADHPLARAAARAGRATDGVLGAEALGQKIDARISALVDFAAPTDAAREEIRATLAELGRASVHESGGEFPPFWNWYRDKLTLIRQAADRLEP